MKERPILFSGEMVRAILDGRKTQTRRVIKPQPSKRVAEIVHEHGVVFEANWAEEYQGAIGSYVRCPYGQPGDRLWVREAHALVPASAYRSSDVQQTIDPNQPDRSAIYRAGWTLSTGGLRWRPSIHMPRWASRITLEVTGVRVERLQEISEYDAVAEGVRDWCCHCGEYGDYERHNFEPHHIPVPLDASYIFMDLWDSINAKRGYSWDSNPWVWVVEFRRIGGEG